MGKKNNKPNRSKPTKVLKGKPLITTHYAPEYKRSPSWGKTGICAGAIQARHSSSTASIHAGTAPSAPRSAPALGSLPLTYLPLQNAPIAHSHQSKRCTELLLSSQTFKQVKGIIWRDSLL